jgi:hypothetical protein
MIESTTDAMKILKDAANRCADEDYLRPKEVDAALDYLAGLSVRKDLIERFRRKLNVSHPLARQSSVRAAYEALEREL